MAVVVTKNLFGDKSATSTGFFCPDFWGKPSLPAVLAMDCRTQGTFPNLHRGHQPWPGKKSWLCHVKHMGKPMSMLPSPGKETISHHWKTWEKKNIKIIKGHGGYKSRLKRNNPSTKKGGFGGMVRIRSFHSSNPWIRQGFLWKFHGTLFVDPQVQLLEAEQKSFKK